MGFFNWGWGKDKTATPASKQPEPQKRHEHDKHPEHHAEHGHVQPHTHPEHHHHPHPAEQKAVPVEQAKPHSDIEMHKLVFRLSSKDPAKCALFIKEMIRKINRHDWHDLSGRIGKHSDGIRMRIDVKGKHDDIQHFITWMKTDHLGVHAHEVMETKLHSMPYSGYPPFQEQKHSWTTH